MSDTAVHAATTHTGAPARRQRLLAVAIRDYGDGVQAFADGIDEQLAAVRALWADADLGERALTWHAPAELRRRDDVETFLTTAGLRDLDEHDVVVLFVTGHGQPGASNRHYLLLPESDPERLLSTAYPTIDLITAALDSRAADVLVVVNACYCGQLDEEFARLRKDLPRGRQDLATLGVIASADHDERPRVREFAELLRRVTDQLRGNAGIEARYLTVDEFDQELDRAARRTPQLLRPMKLWPRRPAGQPSRCLPNPGYRPRQDLVAPARRQVAVTVGDLAYWLGRASGRPTTADTSWYFTGRHTLMLEMCRFLESGSGVLLVTGAAGTGKSALIARAVTLSDPQFRTNPDYQPVVAEAARVQALPPAGSIHAAVLARNHSVDDIAELLIAALGNELVSPPPGQPRTPTLRGQLRQIVADVPDPPCTLVVDGVDEADDPYALLTNLIGPLTRPIAEGADPPVRIVLGIRSTADRAGEPAVQLVQFARDLIQPTPIHQIRTDEDSITTDIDGYVQALLAAVGPYTDRAVDRALIASIVASRVTPSFLDARLAGKRLRERTELQDPSDPHWLATLDEGIVAQLRDDLRDVATPDHPVIDLAGALRAAAFAPGAGIPWADIWPNVIGAILDHAPADQFDATIVHLLGSRLVGYLVSDTEDGRTVYRLAHELLTQVLRRTPRRILEAP